ncbi:hypothetical protein J6590_093493 [Homalodisca vitripennis]|nr:hypothetical protein J6590_093493 [Homalodisca vitripennis]
MYPPLLPEPTAMAAVKLLCAPRLEHYMVLGPVLGQVLLLPTPWRCLWRNKLRQYIDDVKGDVTRNDLRASGVKSWITISR